MFDVYCCIWIVIIIWKIAVFDLVLNSYSSGEECVICSKIIYLCLEVTPSLLICCFLLLLGPDSKSIINIPEVAFDLLVLFNYL